MYTYGMTDDDLRAVYTRLQARYDLTLTNSFSLNEGYEEDCPVIVAKAHGLALELYVFGGDFVLDVMDAARTKGTHWHPCDVEEAVEDITAFMEGTEKYKLSRF